LKAAIHCHVQDSKSLGAQKRENKIEENAKRDSAGENVIDDHLGSPAVAGRQIESGYDKGDNRDGNEQKIEHERSSTIDGSSYFQWAVADRQSVSALMSAIKIWTKMHIGSILISLTGHINPI
jgi:hypothetical protein